MVTSISFENPSASGRHRHRWRSTLIAQDRLNGVDPARVAVIRAPQPVLAAPEQDGAIAGILQVLEDAADRHRVGALGISVGFLRRVPRLCLRLCDPGLLTLPLCQLAYARQPVGPITVRPAEMILTKELIADGGINVEA